MLARLATGSIRRRSRLRRRAPIVVLVAAVVAAGQAGARTAGSGSASPILIANTASGLVMSRLDGAAPRTFGSGYHVDISPDGTRRKHNPSNLRRDVLFPATDKANVQLEQAGIAPIGKLTFHSLRRTYASLRCACGDDVRYTADQLGHEDPRFTLRVYAKATKRRDRLSATHRKAYDAALEWAAIDTTEAVSDVELDVEAPKSPVSGAF